MNYKIFITIPLFTLFFLSFLIGNAATNLISFLLLLYLLFDFFYSKKFRNLSIDIFKNKISIFLCILIFYLSINTFFAHKIEDSFFRMIVLIKTILIILLFDKLILNKNNLKHAKFLIILFLTFLGYVIFTTIFQIITGKSFLTGYDTVINRLSGPFGDELIVGTVLAKLSFLCFYIIKKITNLNPLIYFLIILLFSFCIVVSGERSALILYSIYIIVYYAIEVFNKKNYKFLIYFLSSILIVLLIFSYNIKKSNYFENYSNNTLEKLMYDEGSEFYGNKFLWLFDRHIGQNLMEIKDKKNSDYFKLFRSGYVIWKENMLMGVGLKNFRYVCPNMVSNFEDREFYSCNIHPHNLLLELLSEIGLIGLFLFILFFGLLVNKYYKKRDYLAWFTIFIQLTPMVNASFFTTFNINLFMMSFMFVILATKYNRFYLSHSD